MKRILALLLTLMMALSLTACGGDNNADLVGTWKWTCDITEEFQKGINEGAGMDVPVDAITVEECADAIAKNFT